MEDISLFDTYIVNNTSILTDYDRKIMVFLYQPLLGLEAVALYFTFWAQANENGKLSNKPLNHEYLFKKISSDAKRFNSSKAKLEALGLIKTFCNQKKGKVYLYEIYAPLPPKQFFNHELFATLLRQKLNKDEFNQTKKTFLSEEKRPNDYIDISKKFSEVFDVEKLDTTSLKEIIISDDMYKERKTARVGDNLNLDLLIIYFEKEKVSKEILNKRVLDTFNNMSNLYNLKENDISHIASLCIDEKTQKLDTKEFKEKCKEYSEIFVSEKKKSPKKTIEDKKKLLKEIDSTEFAKLNLRQEKLLPSQQELIDDLRQVHKLKDEVINVLLDYVFLRKGNNLSKPYVSKIASDLVANKIDTMEKAMDHFKPNYKQNQRKDKKTKPAIKKEDNQEFSNEKKETKKEMSEKRKKYQKMLEEEEF